VKKDEIFICGWHGFSLNRETADFVEFLAMKKVVTIAENKLKCILDC
jgi:hypothetical protein